MVILPRKTVQIVGAAPSIMVDPIIEGAERWLMNTTHKIDQGRRYDRVFNLHEPAIILGLTPGAMEWYAAQTFPVYMLEVHPDVQRSVRYPIEAVQKFFARETRSGMQLETCFGSSVEFMIALALMEGFEHIDLMGIECRSEDEYRDQARSVMFWMGRAMGMGRTMTCSATSGLCMVPAIYGYNVMTGAPLPPGQPKAVWMHGHRHSVWPQVGPTTTGMLINGAMEHP